VDVSDFDIGRLSACVDALTVQVKENNEKIERLEAQLHRTRGIGIGIAIAIMGASGIGGSMVGKWFNG